MPCPPSRPPKQLMKVLSFPSHLIVLLLLAIFSCGLAQDCPESNPLECGCLDNNQADYRGAIGVTQTGLQCQDWAVQTPHAHDLQEVTGAGLEDGAFCRNPDGDSSPWCYTTDPDDEWDYCDIPVCNPSAFKACEEANPAECGCRDVKQRDYRGTVNVTENGIPCQRWDQQFPHEHDFYSELNAGKVEENYCRNNLSNGKAWCYTIDPEHRWQYCNISYCDLPKQVLPACAESNPGQCGCSSGNQADYRGNISVSSTGRSCIAWTDDRSGAYNPDEYLDAGLEDGAYCRNPDNDVSPWCFVETIIDGTFAVVPDSEFCRIPVCDNSCLAANPPECGCGNLNRADYRGKLSETRGGIQCQRWDSQFPHSHEYAADEFPELEENYCRNPDGQSKMGPWCFTTDPREENRRQFCNVPYCGDESEYICQKPSCAESVEESLLLDADFSSSSSYLDSDLNNVCTGIAEVGDDWSILDEFQCREYRQIYFECKVCEDGTTAGSDDENWCTFGDRCPTHIELNLTELEIRDTCETLDILKERRQQPIIRALCWKAEQVTSICPILCGFNFDICEEPYGCSDWQHEDLAFYNPLLEFESLVANQLCIDISNNLDWGALSVEECTKYQNVYHLCSFCAARDPVPGFEHPKWCQFESSDYRCNSVPLERSTNVDETCDELTALRDGGLKPKTVDLCWRAEQVSDICPVLCEEIAYLGASTTAQKRGLVWATRVAAFLSFCGASYLLFTILRNAKLRSTVYHRLVIGMAIFDIITAVAWSFASFPQDQMWIYGAGGSTGTCKAQGFFIQLGYTSVFYNVSLSLFYFFTIVKRWSETKLKKAEKYLHAVPIVLGHVLAFGAIPQYNFFIYGCHILRYPDEEELWVVLLFILIPLGLSILTITGTMIVIYYMVRAQTNRGNKWSLGLGKTSSMKRKVMWQCFWYSLAFWVTWPIQFGVYLSTLDKVLGYGFAIMIAIVAPLQGFSNFLVYIRPRLCKLNCKGKEVKKTEEAGSREESATESMNEGLSMAFGVAKSAPDQGENTSGGVAGRDPTLNSRGLIERFESNTASNELQQGQAGNESSLSRSVTSLFSPGNGRIDSKKVRRERWLSIFPHFRGDAEDEEHDDGSM